MAKTTAKGFSPLVEFSRKSGIPVHAQITDSLRQAIAGGRIVAGARLASTRVLAADWGVSRNTILQVFETLGSEGFLISKVGDGTYVADIAKARVERVSRAGVMADEKTIRHPFRGLSRRGQLVVASPRHGQPERPVPFLPNVPDIRSFPIRSWLRLMNEVSGALTSDALAGVTDAGYNPLRSAIARHVGATRGFSVPPERVIITTGSQQGLDLVLRLVVDRGDPVWMEEPGYPGTRAALSMSGANVQHIPVDRDGMRIEEAISERIVPRLICLSAARQFPTGAVLSKARRKAVIDFAERSGSWILEDDFDAEYHFAAPPPPSLAAQDEGNRVFMMGTFSTTLVPSLRMGYLIVPDDLIPHFAIARSISYGNTSLLEQMVLSEMMGRGIYAAHLRRMRTLYRARQIALTAILRRVLGYRVPATERRSGMHIVLPLDPSTNDVRMAGVLAQNGIATRPLSETYHAGTPEQGLLLGFAPFREEDMQRVAGGLKPLRAFIDRRDPAERR